MMWLDFVVGRGTIRSSMLAEQFDMFLCDAASLVDGFPSFAGARFELFGFVLDFLVESFEDGKNLAFEVLVEFYVHVRCSLTLSIHV